MGHPVWLGVFAENVAEDLRQKVYGGTQVLFGTHHLEFGALMLKADGFEGAEVGTACRLGGGGVEVLVYDTDSCIEILCERDGMDYLEAREYFDFNVAGAWVGECTPIFCDGDCFAGVDW